MVCIARFTVLSSQMSPVPQGAPPPSSGGATVMQTFNFLSGYPLPMVRKKPHCFSRLCLLSAAASPLAFR